MRFDRIELSLLLSPLLFFIVSVAFYPKLPDEMAIHWNMKGEPDLFVSKPLGILITPFLYILLALLFVAIPRIDPLKSNIQAFIKHYYRLIVIIVIFLLLVHLITLLWNVGLPVNIGFIITTGFGLFIFYIGLILPVFKRNWFVGIRTPWTLSSDRVWEKTHRLGGKAFTIASIITLIGAFISLFYSALWVLFILVPLLGATFYLIAYSYFEYQKELRELQAVTQKA